MSVESAQTAWAAGLFEGEGTIVDVAAPLLALVIGAGPAGAESKLFFGFADQLGVYLGAINSVIPIETIPSSAVMLARPASDVRVVTDGGGKVTLSGGGQQQMSVWIPGYEPPPNTILAID